VAALLQKVLKDQIEGIDIATPLGKWLEKAVTSGEHNQIWEMILETASKTINDNSTRQLLIEKVREKAQEYKNEGFFKKIFLGLAEFVGALDEGSIVDKMIGSINEFIVEAKGNPHHPVRQRFDKSILNFAHNLVAGDQSTHNIVNDLKRRLIENADAQNIIQGILKRFKSSIKEEIVSNDTSLMNLLSKYLDEFLVKMRGDSEARQKIDSWMKETISYLVTKYHHEIGNMIRASLSRLDDSQLVTQIEEQVGDDLQYIRLNGAIVGGLVGILLEVLKLLVP
jgi:uncharacterized membrane-anchored protein YjiN (DUF445 family)